MALTVEDGSGVLGADSYAARAFIDAYWTARPGNALGIAWLAQSDMAKRDGAAREATAFMDATWGAYYLGARKGYAQGLLWPRVGPLDADDENADGSTADYLPVKDINGVDLPALPPVLAVVVAELAPRALAAPLAPDIDMGARVKSLTKKVGPLEKSTEFFDSGSAPAVTSYGSVLTMLAPILNGAQPGGTRGGWAWA